MTRNVVDSFFFQVFLIFSAGRPGEMNATFFRESSGEVSGWFWGRKKIPIRQVCLAWEEKKFRLFGTNNKTTKKMNARTI